MLTKHSRNIIDRPSPFNEINEMLAHGGLAVKLEKNSNENLLARHPQGEAFSIAEMSDGERSAVIMADTRYHG